MRWIALTFGGSRQIAGHAGHGVSVGVCVPNDGVPAIVGRLKPLVSVRRPGIRTFYSDAKARTCRAGPCPQAECPINVHPGSMGMRLRNDAGVIVESSGVDLSSL